MRGGKHYRHAFAKYYFNHIKTTKTCTQLSGKQRLLLFNFAFCILTSYCQHSISQSLIDVFLCFGANIKPTDQAIVCTGINSVGEKDK